MKHYFAILDLLSTSVYSSLCKPHPCLGCEPVDARVEYPDVDVEEEFEMRATEEGGVDYYLDVNEQSNWCLSEDCNTGPLSL